LVLIISFFGAIFNFSFAFFEFYKDCLFGSHSWMWMVWFLRICEIARPKGW
jgi:hypothetical protein